MTQKQVDALSNPLPFRLSQRRGGGYAAALETLVDSGILIRANVRMFGKASIVTFEYSENYRRILYNAFDPCI